MKYQFGVTIATSLTEQIIRSTTTFEHVCVLDMRRCINNGPRPIEEANLRELTQRGVGYEQMPMSLYSATPRQENNLYSMICRQPGNLLIVTDEPVPLTRYCQDLDIPFCSSNVIIVETAMGDLPVQVAHRAAPVVHLSNPTAKINQHGSNAIFALHASAERNAV